MKEAAIVGGILGGYLVSYAVSEDVGGWREVYEAAVPAAAALAVGMVSGYDQFICQGWGLCVGRLALVAL